MRGPGQRLVAVLEGLRHVTASFVGLRKLPVSISYGLWIRGVLLNEVLIQG